MKVKILNNKLLNRNVIFVLGLMAFIYLGIFMGCAEKATGPTRDTHPAEWGEVGSSNFHGAVLLEKGLPNGLTTCRTCHISDTAGPQKPPGCYTCHNQYPHPTDWVRRSASDTYQPRHATFIQSSNWDLKYCRKCHNNDYRRQFSYAGQPTRTCYECHSQGPEGCTVCHGGQYNVAPPPDLKGNTENTFLTVGAHKRHTYSNRLTNNLSCDQCHIYPRSYDDITHIDASTPGIAEVVFGYLASDSGQTNPRWDRQNKTCISVYCHGDFQFGIQTNLPLWIEMDQAKCGSCHKLPPDSPHPNNSVCFRCHRYSKDTHINGKLD